MPDVGVCNGEWEREAVIFGLTIAKLLYPDRCPVCEEIVRKRGLCEACASKKQRAGFLGSDRVYAAFKYEFIAGAIYHLKYQGKTAYGETLGEMLWEEAKNVLLRWRPDAILPVPLHVKKLRKRGFNQSEFLCKTISKELGVPILPEMVIRCVDTKPMKNLNAVQRQNNLKKAFKIGQNDVKLKTILIVDDIYTTGATTDEISQLLLKAGAGKTYVLTLGSDSADAIAERQGGYL